MIAMSGIITLTTDFGDVYPGIMKGVIATIDSGIKTVDITSSVSPGDITEGAFLLAYASASFPAGTTHLAVVDPGVGSRRRSLVITGEKFNFVGPDNGLLIPAARSQGRYKVYEITSLDFFTKKISPVFHGRDVFAPAAALLAKGETIPGLAEIDDPVNLDFGKHRLEDNVITGRVIYTDTFGNMVTNISGDSLRGLLFPDEPLKVNGVMATFASSYFEGKEGDMLVLVGSHGMAEIAVAGGSAASVLRLCRAGEVRIEPLIEDRKSRNHDIGGKR